MYMYYICFKNKSVLHIIYFETQRLRLSVQFLASVCLSTYLCVCLFPSLNMITAFTDIACEANAYESAMCRTERKHWEERTAWK